MRYGKRRKRQKGQGQRSRRETSPPAAPGAGETAEATQRSRGRVGLAPWWERWPGLLERELRELDQAGITYEIDEKARSRGFIRLRLKATVSGEQLSLIATYPDLFPYIRFEVRAPDLDLPRHQNPFTKGLCLIGRASENWEVDDTLASFINERLPLVIDTALSKDADEVAAREEHQGEPFSDYYTYAADSICIIDSSWKLDPGIESGELIIGLEGNPGLLLRGCVLEVRDSRGATLARADPTVAGLYPKRITGRWVRHPEFIRENDPSEFLNTLASEHPHLGRLRGQVVGSGLLDVTAVVFPEELRWREEGDGWLFVARAEQGVGKGRKQFTYFVRTGRAGRDDLAARVPELNILHDRIIAIVGSGGLGAPSIIEFARSGAHELRTLDFDYFDPATGVRWPLGFPAAGLRKVSSLHQFIARHYPYTKVIPFDHRIGGIPETGEEASDLEELHKLVEGAHLLYDATAEVGLHHLLSDIAAERSLPYVCVSTTPGAWGGRILRIQPGRTEGCWMCLQHATNDGTIPSPPSDPSGNVQPRGCADPTFTGAGFDVAEVALNGVRLAVSTLADGHSGSYPKADWDVAIISFRDESGRKIVPQWKTFKLQRHPLCLNEAAHSKVLVLRASH
jgi:Prokaryotic E2 family B/ThiF family